MTKTYKIAVVGVNDLVGEAVLSILAERKYSIEHVYALAQKDVAGEEVAFGRRSLISQALEDFDFRVVDIAIFALNADIATQYVAIAAQSDCIVIDSSSHFRQQADVPLLIPEVNAEDLATYSDFSIISNPSPITIPLLVALKPLYEQVGLARINMVSYQAVSEAGRKGVNELAKQTAHLLNGRPVEHTVYPKQIAFNVIPQITTLQDSGYTQEEMQVVEESQKILKNPELKINPTTVVVPVFFGHSLALHIETERKISANQAWDLLKKASGVTVLGAADAVDSTYPTAVTHAVEQDAVYIGRIREDLSHPLGLNLWVVTDNIRKGAALNAVQIAELVMNKYLK